MKGVKSGPWIASVTWSSCGCAESRRRGVQGHQRVMDRAHHDLSDAVSHNQMAGRNQKQVAEILYQLVVHLQYLNEECGRIHGDIKPRNLVQMLVEREMAWVLIDLDASCEIGSLAGQKVTSSAYFSPETARQHLASSESAGEAAAPVKASLALEMWSFGAVVYQLCTKDGATLWHSDQADNIDDDQLQQLAHEWDELKAAKLKRIVWPQAAPLVSWLLQENPAHRPQSWDQVMQHPFLAAEAGPGRFRELRDGGACTDATLWAQLTDLGWPALVFSEAHGGESRKSFHV